MLKYKKLKIIFNLFIFYFLYTFLFSDPNK